MSDDLRLRHLCHFLCRQPQTIVACTSISIYDKSRMIFIWHEKCGQLIQIDHLKEILYFWTCSNSDWDNVSSSSTKNYTLIAYISLHVDLIENCCCCTFEQVTCTRRSFIIIEPISFYLIVGWDKSGLIIFVTILLAYDIY